MSEQSNIDTEVQPHLRLAPPVERVQVSRPLNAPGGAHEYSSFDEIHLTDYLKVLYKRRWTAATAFLLVSVSVIVYTFTATPIFEAKTRLLIEPDEQNVVSFKQVVDQDQTRQDYYQTQYNILQSRALARRTLDTLNLWGQAPFGGPMKESFSVTAAVLGAPASIVRLFSSDRSPKRNRVAAADETSAQSRAIDTLLESLTISPIRNSRLVDLKYRLPDAAMATSIVNAVAKNYIEQNLEYKFMASKEASDWLGQRLSEERTQVENAEAKLQQYREENDAISLEDRENIVVQKLADLNSAVTQARTERFQKQALYNQLQSLRSTSDALDTFPAILSNTFIQQQKSELLQLQSQLTQLSEKLGDKHPDIIKIKSATQLAQTKLAGEISKVVQSVRNEYQATLAKENSLVAALNQQKGEALSMNRKAIEYSVLDRDVQSGKQLYQSLLQRAKETGVAGELKTSNIRVIDRAEVPRAPVTPRKATNLSLAVFGGSILAFGLAFFFEYLDSRIKSPDEIKIHLRLPSLGMIPALASKSPKGKEPLINTAVPPGFAEAFRSVRTNVLFSSAEDAARALVVTSSGPGEGKTTIAANLAIGFAQAGQRVLLIDADMRRPRLHEVFRGKQEPGLSNLIVGNAKASECVQTTSVSGLWMLPAGRIPPNPAELLGSQRFRNFLTSLKDHFDCVVVDTPPVMAVTDAVIAANVTTGVVFVIGAEMTSRHSAKAALEQLEHGRAHVIGAVLNRVELEKNAYYYSRYYRREYTSYYLSAAK